VTTPAGPLYRRLGTDTRVRAEHGAYWEEWMRPLPVEGTVYEVIREEWIPTGNLPIRRIYEIRTIDVTVLPAKPEPHAVR
jgi:hypothetical protein